MVLAFARIVYYISSVQLPFGYFQVKVAMDNMRLKTTAAVKISKQSL
jgi:hypothetical protein